MGTDSTPTMVHPPMPIMAPMTMSHGEKPEKFNGTEFKRWQQEMLFYLTTLNLARFLQEDAPALKENETDRQVVAVVEAWKHCNTPSQEGVRYVNRMCTKGFLNYFSALIEFLKVVLRVEF